MAEFRASARSVDMLGRQQIAGIPTAISELFKNAHDAYAANAVADFIQYEDVFILRDDGDGMSRDDFELLWLTLGTSSKSVPGATAQRPGGGTRAILGEKGIGRLAIAAIGPQVLVVTKAKGHARVAALVHWSAFELAHADLAQIKVPVVELRPGEQPDLRTMGMEILTNMSNLITEDDRGLLERVRRDIDQWSQTSVSDMVHNAGFDLAGFETGTVFVILPTSPDLAADLEPPEPKEAAPLLRTLIGFANTMTPGHVTPELKTAFRVHRAPDDVRDLIEEQEFFTVDDFLKADHHFQGCFDEYGQFKGTVSVFGADPIQFPIAWTKARGRKTQCGPFQIDLAYVQGIAKQSSLDANDFLVISEKLYRYGGLYIYRDGIRVLPYGASDFDWLDVEQRRNKSASDWYFSYRRMFGAVGITRAENGRLREKAGREGFATNEAYREFRAILVNFLQQVAIEFFRESGPQSDIYNEGREANERMERARQARAKQVRQRRAVYKRDLDDFFQKVNSGVPEKTVERIQVGLRSAVEQANRDATHETAADSLVRAELKARSALRDLEEELLIRRPRGTALSAELDRRSRAYEAARADVLASVVMPAEQAVDAILREADLNMDLAVHRRRRFDQAIEQVVGDSRAEINEARKVLERNAGFVGDRSRDTAKRARALVEAELVAVEMEAATYDLTTLTDDEFAALRSALEERARAMTAAQSEELGAVADQLAAIAWTAEAGGESGASLLDQLEQLESRVEALTDRAAQDFELVQIGLAVNIVAHEFDKSIESVRDNFRRLRAWAQQYPGMRPMYGDLRAAFDHLDGYLKLFTPLHRRLYRDPVGIRGVDVVRYLNDVFDRRLEADAIELRATAAFDDMVVQMYPSTLYPVLVNLIDNATYWLSNYQGTRTITLDREPGLISVTDSGPGISPGDGEAVFEQGFSRKPAGSGYGLFIAREVLRRDGVDIRLAPPSADRGARLEILIPESQSPNDN